MVYTAYTVLRHGVLRNRGSSRPIAYCLRMGGNRENDQESYWRFTWREQIAFRCTSDFQVQNPPFGEDSNRDFSTGCTCYCENSLWANQIEKCAITDLKGKLIHFVVLTITTIIEVLSTQAPAVQELTEEDLSNLGLSKQTYVPVYYK
jgi:hypothetical protein